MNLWLESCYSIWFTAECANEKSFSTASLYDSYRRRVVVPMVRKAVLGKVSNPRFNPLFRIENVQVVLHPLEIVSVPNELLGEYVESLSSEGSRIMDALDELLTRAWG
jgi:toxin CcdB